MTQEPRSVVEILRVAIYATSTQPAATEVAATQKSARTVMQLLMLARFAKATQH